LFDVDTEKAENVKMHDYVFLRIHTHTLADEDTTERQKTIRRSRVFPLEIDKKKSFKRYNVKNLSYRGTRN
jgi:hypothetical protein